MKITNTLLLLLSTMAWASPMNHRPKGNAWRPEMLYIPDPISQVWEAPFTNVDFSLLLDCQQKCIDRDIPFIRGTTAYRLCDHYSGHVTKWTVDTGWPCMRDTCKLDHDGEVEMLKAYERWSVLTCGATVLYPDRLNDVVKTKKDDD